MLARKRISAVQLAKLMGVSQPYLSRRLNGAVAFDLDDIERIAEVLAVDPLGLLPKGVGTAGNEPNVRLTPMPERGTDEQRTDDGRRARLMFDPSPDRPQGPSGHTWRGSTRPSSTIQESRRRPTAGRPANRTKAA